VLWLCCAVVTKKSVCCVCVCVVCVDECTVNEECCV